MARAEAHVQSSPRFTWRTVAGLFDEAWHREQRRRRRWLVAFVILIAAGVLEVALAGAGGNGPARPGANVAVINKPNSVSVGNRSLPAQVHLTFLPQTIDGPIPVGVTKKFRIQLVDHTGEPVDRAGIAVYLSELIWTRRGPIRASATITERSGGRRALALTNARGTATFAITGTKASVFPTTFYAYLVRKDSAYGEAGALAVRFSAAEH